MTIPHKKIEDQLVFGAFGFRPPAFRLSGFDIRMMFEGCLERGFVAEAGDLETLTALLGHTTRRYEDFARETFSN
jgi:hypothetical protein